MKGEIELLYGKCRIQYFLKLDKFLELKVRIEFNHS